MQEREEEEQELRLRRPWRRAHELSEDLRGVPGKGLTLLNLTHNLTITTILIT